MLAVVISVLLQNSHPINFSCLPVALQSYRVVVHEEQVVLGNDVLLKCNIPSFQADFVSVVSWQDSEGVQHPANYNEGNKAAAAVLEHPPDCTGLITIVLYISCGEDTGNLAAFVFFVILFCMLYCSTNW